MDIKDISKDFLYYISIEDYTNAIYYILRQSKKRHTFKKSKRYYYECEDCKTGFVLIIDKDDIRLFTLDHFGNLDKLLYIENKK